MLPYDPGVVSSEVVRCSSSFTFFLVAFELDRTSERHTIQAFGFSQDMNYLHVSPRLTTVPTTSN